MTFLVDVVRLSPGERDQIYEQLAAVSFMTNLYAPKGTMKGLVVFWDERLQPQTFISIVDLFPMCRHADITGWDLEDMDYVFSYAFGSGDG